MLYFEDGSFIEFKSYEQGREAFQGPSRHIIRMDEEPPESIFGENIARQVTVGRNIIFTFTPLNYSQWLYNQIAEKSATDETVEMFTGHSRENPYAVGEVLDAMERDITDPAERAARLYGEFTFVTGRVYKEYGDHNYVEPFKIPDDWHKSVVIDPHPEKPTAVNWIAQQPFSGKLYVYRELDIEGDVEHICNTIAAACGGEWIKLWLIDPSSRQSARIRGKGRLIDEFSTYIPGLIEANNDRELGWEEVRKLIKNNPGSGPRLSVFKSCPVTDFQLRNYSWKPPLKSGESRGKLEVFKKNDDHCDNIRYRVMWQGNHQTANYSFSGIGVYGNG
jgi:phage terminase large subunit-like protein